MFFTINLTTNKQLIMNKYILTLLTVSLFFNCEEKMTVSFDDTKSMTILAAYDSYMSNDTESIEKLY